MNFCLNRDTKLYYIKSPITDKKLLPAVIECLNPTEFMSVIPKFTEDFSKLMYFASKDKFISHTGNFELRYLHWPPTEGTESELVIGKFSRYPN